MSRTDGSTVGTTPPAADAGPWWSGLIRRKKHVGPWALTALTFFGCLPLLLTLSRIVALPAGDSLPLPGLTVLQGLGEFLNQNFTLDWVPPSDRTKILYLLLLPTGALLVTVARLTLGIRVLGLRAILIAMGFQRAGYIPSLVLMTFVIGTILLIRPWIRKVRLPMYARIAVILCLAAMIMIGAMLIAPTVGSTAIWSVAFFPVIIVAMLAEGVAKTIEKESVVSAAWRVGWTLLLAVLIALFHGVISRFSYQFPELILTQLICVVFIAEFLDLRLLEKWPDRLTRYFAGARPWYTPKPKIAVVRNRDAGVVIGELGRPAPEGYRRQSVQRQVDALREQGFEVKVFEGDVNLLKELGRFIPPDARRGTPGGLVFNLATGTQGEGRFTQLPAMLELAGIPYTGPDPLGQAGLSDRLALMTLMAQAGVPVPRHAVMNSPGDEIDIRFPAAVRPRFEPDAGRVVVRNWRALREVVRDIRNVHEQPAVVEEIVKGREVRVSLLGNEILECLPLLDYSPGEHGKVCPAPLEDALADRIRSCAAAAYRAANCRDFARIDIRLSGFEDPVVVDVKWFGLFAGRGSFMTSAEAAHYTFPALLRRIVTEAAKRYVARMADIRSTPAAAVVSISERRAVSG